MGSVEQLSRTVDALQALLTQLIDQVRRLEARVARLESPGASRSPSWDRVSVGAFPVQPASQSQAPSRSSFPAPASRTAASAAASSPAELSTASPSEAVASSAGLPIDPADRRAAWNWLGA